MKTVPPGKGSFRKFKRQTNKTHLRKLKTISRANQLCPLAKDQLGVLM